jgi:pyridoxamine 5'-phosphate oxidase-like protein
VQPDDPRVRAILRRAMIVHLATRSAAGGPFVTPIWFVVVGDRLIMATGAQTVSVRNLRAHPEAVLLLDADRHRRDTGMLSLRGWAKVRLGPPSFGELARLAWKYYLGGLRVELANLARQRLRQRYYAQSEPAVIEVRPQLAALLPYPGAASEYADTAEPLMSLGRFP